MWISHITSDDEIVDVTGSDPDDFSVVLEDPNTLVAKNWKAANLLDFGLDVFPKDSRYSRQAVTCT